MKGSLAAASLGILALATGCDREPAAGAAPPPAMAGAAPTRAAPAPPPSRRTRVPSPPERIHLRLLGALGKAEIEAPRLRAALRDLSRRPMQYADPFSRLPANLAPLARKVTVHAGGRRYEMREALYAPPPFRATFPVTLPPGARLAFDATAWGRAAFSVEVSVDGETRAVARGTMRAGRWVGHEVDLSAFAGRRVGLRLRTDGPGPHAYFGAPRLYGRAPDAPPSVVLLAIDTLSAEVTGFAGDRKGLTPRIDELAAAGVAFPHAFTNANWTRASTLSMFASEYSTALGINVHSWWLDPRHRRRLYRRFDGMLPELMKRAGYASAAIVNNLFILGYHSAGVEMGFEEVTDVRAEPRDTPDITEATRAFLRRHRDRPFFLFVNYNTPHHPYTPPARLARRVAPGERLHPELRRYLGEVAWVDEHVGILMQTLAELGLRERTLVVLTADHGEGLREDLAYINVAIQRYSRFTHTVNLYDEVMRVPLAFSRPADIPAGRRLPDSVRLLDVAPTILGLVGLPPHPQHRGTDLSPRILGESAAPLELPVFTEGKKCSALRWKGHKLIVRDRGYDTISRRREGFRPRRVPEELYRVEADPRELRDLVGARPPILEELRGEHRKWRQAMARGIAPRAPWSPIGPFSEAPASVPASASVTTGRSRFHLLVSGDGTARVVSGSIHARGTIRRFRMSATETDDALWRARPDRLDFSFSVRAGEDRLYVETDPPDAPLRLQITVDGRPIEAGRLLVGPYGLPLLDPPFELRATSDVVASGPPLRCRGELGVFVWREGGGSQGALSEEPTADDGEPGPLDREVESALRGWGYIQKGDKVLK